MRPALFRDKVSITPFQPSGFPGEPSTHKRVQCVARRSGKAEGRAFLLDAVSVAQHPMCSLSGTAFATPLAKTFGSVFEEGGWRIERFSLPII